MTESFWNCICILPLREFDPDISFYNQLFEKQMNILLVITFQEWNNLPMPPVVTQK